MTRCAKCGRFLSDDDCVEGIDWSKSINIEDGDVAWTGTFCCSPGKGCRKVEVVFILELGTWPEEERP